MSKENDSSGIKIALGFVFVFSIFNLMLTGFIFVKVLGLINQFNEVNTKAIIFLDEANKKLPELDEEIADVERQFFEQIEESRINIEKNLQQYITDKYLCEYKTDKLTIRGSCWEMDSLVQIELLNQYAKSFSETINDADESLKKLGYSQEERKEFMENYVRALNRIGDDITISK